MTQDDPQGLNRVVLIGEVTTEPAARELPDGTVVSTFDVVTRAEDGRVSVPVSVSGVPSVAEVGASVCVIGHVRRRFFRSGTSVVSRTEVVAHVICPVRRRAQVRKAVSRVMDDLSGLIGS